MTVEIIDAQKQLRKQKVLEVAIAKLVVANIRLGQLVELKDINRKMERGSAKPAEKRRYTKGKAKAWRQGKAAHMKAEQALRELGKFTKLRT